MSRFDLDRLLAEAGAEFGQEKHNRLEIALNAIIDDVEKQATEAANNVLEKQRGTLKVLQTKTEEMEARASRAVDAAENAQQAFFKSVSESEQQAIHRIAQEGKSAENRIVQLKASRVMAELV